MEPGRLLRCSWIENQQPDPGPTEGVLSRAAVYSGFSRVDMLPGEITSILTSSKRSLCGGALVATSSGRAVLSLWTPECRGPAVDSDPIAWSS